jgi:hypothetical protein
MRITNISSYIGLHAVTIARTHPAAESTGMNVDVHCGRIPLFESAEPFVLPE